MNRVTFYFYIGKGGWTDALIRWWTIRNFYRRSWRINSRPLEKAAISHCGVSLQKGKIWEVSACKPLGEYPIENEFDWRTYSFDITPTQWERALEILQTEKGSLYDWLGLFYTQILGLKRESKTRWFCSEFCSYFATEIGLPTNGVGDNYCISPQLFFKRLRFLWVWS